MNRNPSIVMAFLSLAFFFTGCAGSIPEKVTLTPPSRLEMDYGTSFKLMKVNQIANPEAEKNLDPVAGMDGQAAKAALDKYRKDFEKPPAPPAYTLSIGTDTMK
jgi:hypothetical protein